MKSIIEIIGVDRVPQMVIDISGLILGFSLLMVTMALFATSYNIMAKLYGLSNFAVVLRKIVTALVCSLSLPEVRTSPRWITVITAVILYMLSALFFLYFVVFVLLASFTSDLPVLNQMAAFAVSLVFLPGARIYLVSAEKARMGV